MGSAFSEKVVFITGGSAGIGAGLGREFAHHGAKVALAARSVDRLNSVIKEIESHGGVAMAVACDVTSRESLDATVASVLERFGRLDVVVANAGFGVSGAMQALTTEDYRRQFDTNVFGVLDTIYAALPLLIESRGQVVLISSVMGKLGRAGSSAYVSSKFAVCGLAESIHYELKPQGIAVTCINPGLVESQFRMTNNASEYQSGESDPAPQWLVVPTEVAARTIVRAVRKRKREVTITGHGKALVALHQFAPWIFHAIMGAMKPIVWRNPSR